MYANYWFVIGFICYDVRRANWRFSHSDLCLEPQSSGKRCWRLENPCCSSCFVSKILCV
jgi:hypothetical protein